MDANETIGKLIDETARRDAIHVAVFPMVAYHDLKPGHHVGIMADGTAGRSTTGNGIGIVDPFLARDVKKGQRFWVMLYPRTVTGLRHVWTHPTIPEEPGSATAIPARSGDPESVRALEAFAAEIGRSYEQLVDAAIAYLDSNEYWCEGDAFEGVYLPDGFWHDFERATGKWVNGDPGGFFRCSC